ncbi:hypothetical protein GTW37_11340 [Streptomyces sp. SID4931]|nr:hypothetical protein [Streptomyces sp. SID4931]
MNSVGLAEMEHRSVRRILTAGRFREVGVDEVRANAQYLLKGAGPRGFGRSPAAFLHRLAQAEHAERG